MDRFRIAAVFLLLLTLTGGCSPSALPPNTPPLSTQPTLAQPPATASEVPPIGPADTQTPFAPSPTIPELPTPTEAPPGPQPVTGIILFIGDGMGASQRQAAQWLAFGQESQLAMDRMPVLGYQETSAADRAITDSGAAATALASGVKANYQAIGVDPNGQPVETILERAQAQGWAVGLVTTVPLAHATPAAFAAHVEHRGEMTEIAAQIFARHVDVLLGGGEDDFLPGRYSGCYPNHGHRTDGLNLVRAAEAQGYRLVCSREELAAVDPDSTPRLIGFFGDDEIVAPYSPNLAEMTEVAIQILSQDPDGFFLMVEAGQIDWAGHDNQAKEAIQFTIGLDAAVTAAQIYAVGQPNTLIIVTGDHETGGMTLNLESSGSFREDGPFLMPDGTSFWVDWAGGSHTGVDIPVTAQGPYSQYLAGEYPNTWIFQVMAAAMAGGLPTTP